MKNKLLITTALFAVVSATSANAEPQIINPETSVVITNDNGEKEYQISNVTGSLMDNPDVQIDNVRVSIQDNYSINAGDKLTMNEGRLDVNGPGGVSHTFKVDGGDIVLNGGQHIQDDKGIFATGMEISGGNIILNNSGLTDDGTDHKTEDGKLQPASSIDISGGKITMNSINGGSSWIDSHGHVDYTEDGEEIAGTRTGGKINISGNADIVVNGGGNKVETNLTNANVWAAKDINMSGGSLTINKNSNLITVVVPDSSPAKMQQSTINLTDAGTINLSGGLLSHVSGNGTINFDDSASQISGDVSGSNLNFNADHSLSQAITGAISKLASLNVNKGTLTYDKPVANSAENISIESVNVAKGAGLNINSFMQARELNLAGNVAVNSDVMAQGNINITDGTVNMNGASLNARNEGINMTGGTVNMNDGGEDPDLTFWAAKDINIRGGTINMNGSEASIDTFYDWLDENDELMPKPEKPGDVNINGGTVNVNSSTAEISSEGKVEVSNGGVINVNSGGVLSSFNSFVVDENGMDSVNKGTINVIGTGSMNLAGKLIANVSGDGSLNFKSSTGLVEGDINGTNLSFDTDHSLSKAISGTIGDLASLNVNKGTLSFDKSTGTIANLNVSSTLDVGTNTVNATNVAFKDNSTLKFTVAGTEDGSYGKIKANNISVSNKGTVLDLTLNSSVLGDGESKDFTILDAATISGEFAQFSESSRYDFEKLGNGKYKITGKATAADIVADAGGTSNNAGTASAWDSVELEAEPTTTAGTIAVTLADLSNKATTPEAKKAYVDALTAVAPEAAPMVQQTQSQTSNQVFGAVGTRLSGGSVSTGGEGMSSGDNIFERAAMWVQGLFNKSELENTSDSYGFDADSSGIAMGVEKYINDDTKLGLGYAYTNTDIDGFMRSTDVDTHTAIIYGEYKPSNWYVNGVATYGWSDYEENKNVAGIGVKSKYDAESFGLQAMTGYDMQVKGFGLTPEVGLRYVHISQDAYTDTAGQSVSGNDSDILTGVIGAKVTKAWQLSNGMMIKPEAKFALTYDLFNDDASSVVSLANGSAYTVEGEALDRFGMEFGAGVTAEVNDNIEFSLGYEGKFRQDYQDHTGLINAKYKF